MMLAHWLPGLQRKPPREMLVWLRESVHLGSFLVPTISQVKHNLSLLLGLPAWLLLWSGRTVPGFFSVGFCIPFWIWREIQGPPGPVPIWTITAWTHCKALNQQCVLLSQNSGGCSEHCPSHHNTGDIPSDRLREYTSHSSM